MVLSGGGDETKESVVAEHIMVKMDNMQKPFKAVPALVQKALEFIASALA